MSTDYRKLISRTWMIKSRSTISVGLLMSVGHFVFHLKNNETRRQFTARFWGFGRGIGGGFSFNTDAPFESIGWTSLRCVSVFSMSELHRSEGKLTIASVAALLSLGKITVSGWRESKHGLRNGILFESSEISDFGAETPKPRGRPGISLQYAEMQGYWTVDRD